MTQNRPKIITLLKVNLKTKMRLSLKQLKNLDVETKSGVELGHVHDLYLDTNGQLVAQYLVKSSMLSREEYLISRDQVISFEEAKLVVDDNMKPVETEKKEIRHIDVRPKPLAAREES